MHSAGDVPPLTYTANRDNKTKQRGYTIAEEILVFFTRFTGQLFKS